MSTFPSSKRSFHKEKVSIIRFLRRNLSSLYHLQYTTCYVKVSVAFEWQVVILTSSRESQSLIQVKQRPANLLQAKCVLGTETGVARSTTVKRLILVVTLFCLLGFHLPVTGNTGKVK